MFGGWLVEWQEFGSTSKIHKIHSGKLTQQWEMDHLKMYFLHKMVIFQPAMLVYRRVKHETITLGRAPFVSKAGCFLFSKNLIDSMCFLE